MVDLRSERGRATRDRLIEAARELFGDLGYEATSIDAVLSKTGVKRGALYHHFESKQALYEAVLDRVFAETAAAVAKAARAETDPVESLRAGCGAWLDLAVDPRIQRIGLLDPPSVIGWTRWRELDEQHFLGGVRHNLHLIAAGGGLPEKDVDLLAHMLVASVTEAALLIARADDPRAARAQGRAAVDILLDRLVGGGRPRR